MNAVHPIFEDIFRSFMPHTESIDMQAYRNALRKHDWYYIFSRSDRVHDEGRKRADQLLSLQPILDPDFKVWNSVAPETFRKTK